MLSRSHIASGITAALVLISVSPLPINLTEFIPAAILGSVTPDIDTGKSWASQVVPFIDDTLRDLHLLKHRGITHGISGIMAMILLYFFIHNDFTLGFCVGYITHCITDKILSVLKIKITPRSDRYLFNMFWIANIILTSYIVYYK